MQFTCQAVIWERGRVGCKSYGQGTGIMGVVKKILLVEDDQDFKQVVADLLEQEGYIPIIVSDCESAIRALETEAPDLVLLDLVLPDGTGFEICKKATCGDSGNSHVPVIILSAKSSLDCKIKSFMSGAVKYFTKPFDVEELIEAIHGVLVGPGTPQPTAT